jgi:3-oxoacyl-[acyl-carrier-protein] synthase-3
MMNEVYITNTSHYLPNGPISNDEMESYLGMINGKPSRSRSIVLRNNGIKQRYYALDRDGVPTHTNSQMAALAVRGLYQDPAELKTIKFLSCGTSSPDQMMPSHGVMVHGWLPETGAIEVVSPSGVCCSAMHALKFAWYAVRSGDAKHAVSVGSERLSRILRSNVFDDEAKKLEQLEANPYIGFEKEFLRWMLSDGAAAFRLAPKPGPGTNLKIEWMESISFADRMEPCMYMASDKLPDGTLKSYMDYSNEEIFEHSILSIKQDVKLLGDHIVELGGRHLVEVFKQKGLTAEDIDHFLPHMSSDFFRPRIHDRLKEMGLYFPYEKWLINLPRVGNVGAGSIYLMVDELFHSGKLKKGEKVLLLVPESSRFSYVFCLLTVH